MDEITIQQLPVLTKDQLLPTDLLLVSHNAGIGTEDGQLVYISNKLSVEDFSYIVRGNIQELIPDDVTILKNANNQLFVNKVRISNVAGLGDLATKNESELKLSSMSHINIWTGTLNEYDAISLKKNDTLYFITDNIF